ncbi:DMT family transporter [Salinicola rhizosphaerae]|uniref:Permease n=1 Tax=Salinicola rhizosphaerae TaxID=1443141 RepID=A0ABQ3E0E1_9GAMM|nr:DMT family transporter [Salinicola rhizosphaerae]GHB17238.1 permease [Salinicola rhizosphaerae]
MLKPVHHSVSTHAGVVGRDTGDAPMMQGVPAILAGVAAMAAGDALVKVMATEVSLLWLIVARSAAAVVLLMALQWMTARGAATGAVRGTARRGGTTRTRARVRARHRGLIAVRSLLLAGMWLCYYLALPHLSLSLAAALFYTSPIFICLFSIVIKVESFSPRRALALGVGVAGVVTSLEPWQAELNGYTLLPVIAAALYAAAQLMTRTRLRDADSTFLAAAMNGALLALSAVIVVGGLLPWGWAPFGPAPETAAWSWTGAGIIVALAVLISITAKMTAKAFQTGLPTVIGIFDYAYLLFAAGLGWLCFGETPAVHNLLGMALIVASGAILLPGLRRLMPNRH